MFGQMLPSITPFVGPPGAMPIIIKNMNAFVIKIMHTKFGQLLIKERQDNLTTQ